MKQQTDKVLAKVGDREILEKNILEFIKIMGPEGKQYNNPEGKKRILDELVAQQLLLEDAKKHHLEEEEDFKKELEIAKETVLKQYAIKKLFKDINITEEELKKYYEDNKERFRTPKTILTKHILVEDKKEANKIKEEIEKGEISFEDAARKYSTCPSKENGGDLGEVREGQMVPEFEKALFSQNPDVISAPVKTQFGYHLIKIDKVNEPKYRDLDSIRFGLHRQLIAAKQQNIFDKKIDELKKDINVEFFDEN